MATKVILKNLPRGIYTSTRFWCKKNLIGSGNPPYDRLCDNEEWVSFVQFKNEDDSIPMVIYFFYRPSNATMFLLRWGQYQ